MAPESLNPPAPLADRADLVTGSTSGTGAFAAGSGWYDFRGADVESRIRDVSGPMHSSVLAVDGGTSTTRLG